MTRLVTPRLVLRKARATDTPALHAVMSDARAMRYWSRPAHETLDETAAYVARMIDGESRDGDDFVIEHQGRVVGKAGMWRLPEVGFLLHPDLWGQGLAREAMVAVIAHLFARPDVSHLTAEADPRNAASLALLGRLGFLETHRAERTLLWGEEWCDSVYLRRDR